MTASEWADAIDLMDECCGDYTIMSCKRAELADHLRRVPTDEESLAIRAVASGARTPAAIGIVAGYVERITPEPPVEWHDVGEGSIADLNGWTLTVRPGMTATPTYAWSVSCHRRDDGDGHGSGTDAIDSYPTLDAAKSAAVKAARKLGA